MRANVFGSVLVLSCLVLAGSAAALRVAPADLALQAHAGRPTEGTQTIYLNLSGAATLGRNHTADGFQVTVNVSGPVTFSGNNGGGNGETFSGDNLETQVQVTYKDDQGNTYVAESFTATTSIHGEKASYLGQGLDGFRFNLEMQGRDGPVLHVGLHGNTTGTQDHGYAVTAGGNANVKHDDGADNYLLAVTGSAEFR